MAIQNLIKIVAKNMLKAICDDKAHSTWDSEKKMLFELALSAPGQYVIEIGCMVGATTIVLAKTSKTIIAIDPWDESESPEHYQRYKSFLWNTIDYPNVVNIRKKSDEAIELLPNDLMNNCGLVFIDGKHIDQQPYNDIQNYYKFLSKGGVMVVHDVFNEFFPNVKSGMEKFIKENVAPSTIYYLRHFPSNQEIEEHKCQDMGLCWFFKS